MGIAYFSLHSWQASEMNSNSKAHALNLYAMDNKRLYLITHPMIRASNVADTQRIGGHFERPRGSEKTSWRRVLFI